MPLYEFACPDCNARFELLVRPGVSPACPHCGGSALQKQLSVPAVLSGQTARPAGRTCCGRDERCDAPPCSSGDPCRHG